jgi:glutathionyl-hydroquinone reductase
MLNSAFDAFTDVRTDYYPAELRPEIDRINELVYSTVNNGVYRAGFATTQAAYEEAARALFATLDQLEERLSRQRYLAGRQITEAVWRWCAVSCPKEPARWRGRYNADRPAHRSRQASACR